MDTGLGDLPAFRCQRYLVVDRADLPDPGVAPGAVEPADELLEAGIELVEGGEGETVVEL